MFVLNFWTKILLWMPHIAHVIYFYHLNNQNTLVRGHCSKSLLLFLLISFCLSLHHLFTTNPTYISSGCLLVSSLSSFLYLSISPPHPSLSLYSSSHHHFATVDHLSSLFVVMIVIEIKIWVYVGCDWAFVLCVFIWVWWLLVWWQWLILMTYLYYSKWNVKKNKIFDVRCIVI